MNWLPLGRAQPRGAEPRAAAGDRGSLSLPCSLSSSRVTSRGGPARESLGSSPGDTFAFIQGGGDCLQLRVMERINKREEG